MRHCDYQADKSWSTSGHIHHIWDGIYRSAFGRPIHIERVTSRQMQIDGIDTIVRTANGLHWRVDEKTRRDAYGDVLLEVWSDRNLRRPGWIAKPLKIDFLAYAILPICSCYFFPYHRLRSAWTANGEQWIRKAYAGQAGYRTVFAHNQSWITESIAVETSIIVAAVGNCRRIEWRDE